MTDTGPSRETPSHWSRWKGILLVVSLALNLLVLGLVAAAGIKHGWGPPPGSIQQATLLRFARTLPAERKKEIWDEIRPQLRATRPLWRELRKTRADVRSALIAEPFDVARYREAHDRLLDVEVKLRQALQPLFDKVATQLTAEERRGFARWQAEAEPPWRRREREPSDHGDDEQEKAPQKSQAAPVSVTQTPGGKQ